MSKTMSQRQALESCKTQLDSLLKRVETLIAENSDADFLKRPDEKTWSMTEALEHLNLIAGNYWPTLRKAVQGAPQASPDKPVKLGRVARLALWFSEPPPKIKVPTFSGVKPHGELEAKTVQQKFLNFHEELSDMIAALQGKDLSTKLDSPFGSRPQFNLYEAISFTLSHDRRHVWQAEQIRKRLP